MWHKYFTFPTYLPLALIGIPPSQMLLHREMNLLYQFWVHTTQVPKLWVSLIRVIQFNSYCLNSIKQVIPLVANRIYSQYTKPSSSASWSQRILVKDIISTLFIQKVFMRDLWKLSFSSCYYHGFDIIVNFSENSSLHY